MKPIEHHFRDWESHVFGFGYGTGEEYILPALKTFFSMCCRSENGQYRHDELEKELCPATAWLLINALANADLISYGTSPRFGWLTPQGMALKGFVLGKSAAELADILSYDEGYVQCEPDFCNCGPNGYSPKKLCHNPFWTERSQARQQK